MKNVYRKATRSSFLDFKALECDLFNDSSKLSMLAPSEFPESVFRIELIQVWIPENSVSWVQSTKFQFERICSLKNGRSWAASISSSIFWVFSQSPPPSFITLSRYIPTSSTHFSSILRTHCDRSLIKLLRYYSVIFTPCSLFSTRSMAFLIRSRPTSKFVEFWIKLSITGMDYLSTVIYFNISLTLAILTFLRWSR